MSPPTICIVATSESIRSFMANTPTSRSQITCFRCAEQGHYKSECFHWKTRICYHFNRGNCRDATCSFAHGEKEIRSPWMPRCVRVVKQDGQLITLGCKKYGHTFKNCPHAQNLVNENKGAADKKLLAGLP